MKKMTLNYFVCILCLLPLSNSLSVYCQEKTDSIQEKPKGPPDTSSWQYNTYGTYYLGNVGIGTPYPIETLDINGSVRGNQSGALRINSGNGYVDIGAKNASWAHFNTDRPMYYFDKEIRVNSGFIGSYDENLSLTTSGSTKMTITTAGNVGVGVTSPAEKLQVAGKIHSTSGGFKFPDGTVQTTAATGSSGAEGLWTLVEEYGAVGNGTTDDSQAIQDAISSGKLISLSPKKTYLVKKSLTIGQYQTLNIPAKTILKFDATSSSFQTIIMDKNSTLTGRGRIQSSRWAYTATAWNLGNQKAAISIIGWNVRIDLGEIYGFEYGISMSGNYPICGCNIHIGKMYDNVINILMYPSGLPETSFVNQNYLQIDGMGAEFAHAPNAYAESFGIYMDYCPNNNHFKGQIDGCKTGILLAGAFNHLEGLRLESCVTKIRIIGSETRNNNLFGEYGDIGEWSGKIVNQTGKSLEDVLQIYGVGGQTKLNDLWADNYYNLSDRTIKKDIQSVKNALNKIMSIRGTSYNLKSDTIKKSTYGFIAQELKEVLPELVVMNPLDSLYAVNYDGVIPVLVEAFKEQQGLIEIQESKIEELKTEIIDLVQLLKDNDVIKDYDLKENNDMPELFQNTPNPFNEQTEISYYIPGSPLKAYILIFDMNGRQLKRFDTLGKGQGKVIINRKELTPGMYIYSLIIDEKEIGTKRMILTE